MYAIYGIESEGCFLPCHRQELLSAHKEQEADKFADVVSFSTSVCLSPLLRVHFWSILDSNSINP